MADLTRGDAIVLENVAKHFKKQSKRREYTTLKTEVVRILKGQRKVVEPATHIEALKGALKSVTGGKDIDLEVKVDPAIIGGLIVKVGSRMIDSSLRTKLNAIKFAMKEAR